MDGWTDYNRAATGTAVNETNCDFFMIRHS